MQTDLIKSNELRIGNKLQKDNGEVFTVLRLDNTNDILTEEQRGLLTLGYNLFGIPLTKEWLLSFGFDVVSDFWNIKELPVEFRILFLNGIYIFQWGRRLETKLQYVHQLQNLYFALTGTELTINNHEQKH